MPAPLKEEPIYTHRLLFRGDARQGRRVSPGEHDSPVGVSLLRHFVPPPLKRRLSQIVSSLEEMPDRAEESARANDVRTYDGTGILHIVYGFRFVRLL